MTLSVKATKTMDRFDDFLRAAEDGGVGLC